MNIAVVALGALLAACSEGQIGDVPEPIAMVRDAAFESTPLGTPRSRHTATLLADGNVLVAGGAQQAGGPVPIARAELYASFAGGFEPLPHMKSSRYAHTATRLFDGTVLLAGGFGHDGVGLRSAELYLPDSRTFISAGEMTGTRGAHTATLLEDGRVLILGGTSAAHGSAASDAELYDPQARAFAKLANAPLYPAPRNVAVTLADSRVLILWSESRLIEVFNPATSAFSAAPATLGTLPADLGQIVAATRLADDSLAIYGTKRLWRTGLGGACKYGQELCNGQCVDLHYDDGNCGSCGTRCGDNQTCVNGSCACPAPYTACGADCVILGSDNDDHCGECFRACPGSSFCNIGQNCICNYGCGPNCTPPFDDPENCGICGVACAAGQFCMAGECRPDCAGQFVPCGSKCVDTNTDPQNCGGCGVTCETSCVSGFCAPACGPDQAACFFGIELACADIQSDNLHCGGCSQPCGPGRECWAGHCWPAAPSAELDAQRGAVITRSADMVWMTENSTASVFAETDLEAWTNGRRTTWWEPDFDVPVEPFAGVGHTTTALPDGSILTIGGLETDSAMRFEAPWHVEALNIGSTDSYAITTMSVQLRNGHLLFAIGSELFDYDGSALSQLGSVDNGGAMLALVPQASGRVLTVGGVHARGSGNDSSIIGLAVAHLFDPGAGTAVELDMELDDMGRALPLSRGAVLLAGSSGLQLISPEGAEFRVDAQSVELGCDRPGLVRLPNGRVLVVGGTAFYEFDPATLALSEPVSSVLGRCLSTQVVRPDGTVLVIGGRSETDSLTWEIYDSNARTALPFQSPSEAISNFSIVNWFDGPLFFPTNGQNGVRQLNWGQASLDYALVPGEYVFLDSPPLGRGASLVVDGSILVDNGLFWEGGGGIRMARLTMGRPAPRARFDFQDAPLLHMSDDIDFNATFPNASFPGSSPEGSSGSTASSSSALPVPVWFPADGYPSMGALTRVGSEVTLRVPKTPFPGLGLMFLAANGKLTGIGPVEIVPSANGAQCVDSAECDSGHCADGVCCNEACDGICEACSIAGHAAEDGVCGPASAGARDDNCEVQPIETCGLDGTCDGDRGCARYPDGTECVSGAECSGGECVVREDTPQATCNDNDQVVEPNGELEDCGQYRCRSGKCLDRCVSNRDCKGGFACTTEGTCGTPLDNPQIVSCGCRLPLRGRPGFEHGLAGLLAVVAALRRRRLCRSDNRRSISA